MAAAAQPARGLHVVGGTGEVVEHKETANLLARIEQLQGDLKAAEKDLVVKRRQLTELRADKVRERTEYAGREKVRKVHDYWNRRLGNKLALTADRFDAVRGMLEETDLVPVEGGKAKKVLAFTYPEDFKRAVDGAWFDPFVTKQKNGREKRHDDLALICRDAKTFRSFMERAPAPKVAAPRPELFVTEWA